MDTSSELNFDGSGTFENDGFQIYVGYSSGQCSLISKLENYDCFYIENGNSYNYEIKVYKTETANSDHLWSADPGRSYPFLDTINDIETVPFLTTRFSSPFKASPTSLFHICPEDTWEEKMVTKQFQKLVDLTWLPETGQVYEIHCIDLKKGNSFEIASCTIQASFNLKELWQLYNKAEKFAEEEFIRKNLSNFQVELTEVYRWNCKQYWESLPTDSNGRPIMKAYQKDDNGHNENNVNHFLKGLFFATQSKYGKAHFSRCPSDNKKFVMPINKLIDSGNTNFYFSDFYCNFTRDSLHYVNIVICKKESHADRYCAQKLLPLPQPNKFLKIIQTEDGYTLERSCVVWVELFFTDDVLLDDGNLVEEKADKNDVIESKGKIFRIERNVKYVICILINGDIPTIVAKQFSTPLTQKLRCRENEKN
uniref:PHYHIP_C domain-containing protein n=1 Tax=Panagrellus redivivus TaxID=6233 RepID=A0A7E4WA73_PANRE